MQEIANAIVSVCESIVKTGEQEIALYGAASDGCSLSRDPWEGRFESTFQDAGQSDLRLKAKKRPQTAVG
jgi:hypothetical protein